jgi:glutaconate CoA-transferase subunit B
MTREFTFTDIEAHVCTVSRMIEEDKLYFVQMWGPPLFAVLLAKRTRIPGVGFWVEEGAIAPSPQFPLHQMMLSPSRAHYRSVAWESMNTVFAHLALGHADYGLLSAVQVDRFGNFNSTILGTDYDRPERRFGGPGGANEIASQCWRTVVMTKLEKRKFVDRVDFISSPGYLDGTPGARERAGLPPNTGPYKIVTERAVFGFDEKTHHMRLDALAPWSSVEDVLERMAFKPLIADKLEVLEPPADEELTIIRAEIDPEGYTLNRGQWLKVTV